MTIIVDQQTKTLIQGITGKQGQVCVRVMQKYGCPPICGVTPGKGGQNVEGVPVYNSIKEAKEKHEVTASIIYVPPRFAKHAVFEAIENNIPLIVCITEGIPIHDTAKMIAYAKQKGVRLIGPSSVGVISPGKAKLGCVGGSNKGYSPGRIGIISKSGGMSSETALVLSQAGLGQSTVVGIGGDVLAGSSFTDILELFEQDSETDAVVIFGEIGGTYEEQVAEYVKTGKFTKPLVAFISGKFAASLPNVQLGHAGAIIEGDKGTRESKVKALKGAGVIVAEVHHDIPRLVKEALQ